MTLKDAVLQLIAGTPHLARYLQDVAEGAKVKDTSYVFRAVATKARAVRAHGPGSLSQAADTWTRMGTKPQVHAVVEAIDAICERVPA